MKKLYFVTYTFKTSKDLIGFAWNTVTRDRPIATHEDLEQIQDDLRKHFGTKPEGHAQHGATNPVIMDWKPMEEEA